MSSSLSSPRSATLLASTRRPSISKSPNARTSRTWATSSGVDGAARLMVPTESLCQLSLRGYCGSALVPVGSGADMARRVQGTPAERAGRPSCGDHLAAPASERTSRAGLDHDPQDRLQVTGFLGLQRGFTLFVDLELFLTVMALDDDDTTFGVPPETHRPDPELVLDRCRQRIDDLKGLGCGIRGLTRGEVVEKVIDPVGQSAQLLLLQRHGGQPRTGAGLQEEGPLPRVAHCARDEPVWWVELKDRHTDDFSRVSRRPRQPARR